MYCALIKKSNIKLSTIDLAIIINPAFAEVSTIFGVMLQSDISELVISLEIKHFT
jgi:hypothetical protein